MRKASVLPVPVCDRATMCERASACGSTAACMAVSEWMWRRERSAEASVDTKGKLDSSNVESDLSSLD